MKRKIQVQDTDLNQEDLATAQAFLDEYSTLQKLTKGSVVKYHAALWAFLKEIKDRGTTLATLDRKACLDLLKWLQTDNYWSEDTREDYMKRWSKFYSWAADKQGQNWSPDALKLFSDREKRYRYKKDKNKITKKGTFTPEEVLQIVHLETNFSYQVFWAVLYESGMRARECLTQVSLMVLVLLTAYTSGA